MTTSKVFPENVLFASLRFISSRYPSSTEDDWGPLFSPALGPKGAAEGKTLCAIDSLSWFVYLKTLNLESVVGRWSDLETELCVISSKQTPAGISA